MLCPAPACRPRLSTTLRTTLCLLLGGLLAWMQAGAADLIPYGTAAGDTALVKGDDTIQNISWVGQGPGGSTLVLNFAGKSYTGVWLNNNGCLSFSAGISSYSPVKFPLTLDILAPLWCDVDTRAADGGTVWYRTEQNAAALAQISSQITSHVPTAAGFQATFAFVATWDHVGYYNLKSDKLNTFQAVIASNGLQSYVMFLYADNGINWLVGDASNNLYPAAGIDAGDGVAYYNHPLTCTAGLTTLPTLTNTTPSVPGLYIFRIDGSTIPEVPAAPTTGTATASNSQGNWSVGVSPWTGDATVWRNGFNAIWGGTARSVSLSYLTANNFQINTSGLTFFGSAGTGLQFNQLQFAAPTDEVIFSSSAVIVPHAANAVTQGTLRFRDSTTLVALGTGTINGGTIYLRNAARLLSYSADAITSQTALVFDSSFGSPGGTLDLRGLGATAGTLNSVGTGGVITNSGATPAAVTVAGAGASDFRGQIVDGTAATALTKSGTGTLTLYGTSTYTGPTSISAGTLRLGAAAALPAASVVGLSAGATLDLNGYAHTFPASTGGGTLALGTGTATYNLMADASMNTVLSGTGGFVKTGSAVLTLAAASSHTGPTTLSGGTLRLGVNDALATCSAVFLNSNATLDLNGHDQTVTNLDSYNAGTSQFDSSTVVLGGARLKSVAAVTNNWTGNVTGTGTFEKSGPEPMHWLWGSSSFSGALVITQGVLSADAVNVLSPNAAVSVADGATLWLGGASQTVAGLSGAGAVSLGTATLTVNQSADSTHSGTLSTTGTLVKNGGGLLNLSGTVSGGGAIQVNAGELGVNGPCSSSVSVGAGARLSGAGSISAAASVAAGGTVAPGANGVGTLTTGPLALAGTYACQLSGTDADKIAVNGDLDLTGATLVLTGTATASPVVIATYTGTLTGGFAQVPAPFSVDYSTPGQVRLVVANYYTTWAATHQLAGSPTADSDHDGTPNLLEYALNLNPAAPDAPPSPISGLVVSFSKNAQAIANRDLRYIIETSADLITWTAAVTQGPDDPGYTSPTISHTLPQGQAKVFARLRVEFVP